MVLLEAMFFETVALTTPNGGADMLIQDGENGVVLTKDHPEEWAVRMLDLAEAAGKEAAHGSGCTGNGNAAFHLGCAGGRL